LGASLSLAVTSCSSAVCVGCPLPDYSFVLTVSHRCIVSFDTVCSHTSSCSEGRIFPTLGTCNVAVTFEDGTSMDFTVTFTRSGGGWTTDPPNLDIDFAPLGAGATDASSE